MTSTATETGINRAKRTASKKGNGSKKRKNSPGKAGVKYQRVEEDPLLGHVAAMSQSMNMISKSLLSSADGVHSQTDEIKDIVKSQVKAELESTNQTLQELKDMLKSLVPISK